MARNRNDNFTQKTIKVLKERVGHKCSNPDCKCPTSGPQASGGAKNVGVAAHICAASPGGPRYNSQQSPAERKSIDNAIWLCQTCSVVIDRDHKRYSVETLKAWKSQAEFVAEQEIGRRVIPREDTKDVLVSALTGQSPSLLYTAIQNIHDAAREAFERLDSRFQVKSEYRDGVQCLSFHAKEDVPLSVLVRPEYTKEFAFKHAQLVDNGVALEIASDAISFSGSELIEKTFGAARGTLKIIPRALPAHQTLILVGPERHDILACEGFTGEITFGRKSFTFCGGSFDELLSFSYTMRQPLERASTMAHFTTHFDRWKDLDLRALPYFDKLYNLFKRLREGWAIDSCLEISGTEVGKTTLSNFISTEFLDAHVTHLEYVRCCRVIANFLNVSLHYDDQVEFDEAHYERVLRIAKRIEGKLKLGADEIKSRIRSTLTLHPNFKEIFEVEDDSLKTIKIGPLEDSELVIFGKQLSLPSAVVTMHNVRTRLVRIVDEEARNIEVEHIPGDGFCYSETYEKLNVE